MSTDIGHRDADAQVIALRPAEAQSPEATEAAASPPLQGELVLAPVLQPGSRRPVIAEPFQRRNLRGTVAYAAGLTGYRAAYHGLRLPLYLLTYLWHAIRGLFVLARRVIRWAYAPHLDELVSLAVAAGRSGHTDAMSAHKEGRQTRKARAWIVAASALVTVVAVLAAVTWLPWPAWPPIGLVALLVLATHGRPEGKHVIQAAIVAPQYQVPTPAIITKALGSLGIDGINQAIRTGQGITYLSDVHRDGDGWATELDLPHGVTATMVLAKRPQLASGLRRPLSATWPEGVPSEHEGRLRLWVGFHDISKLKPAVWPLAKAGTVDVFGGFPFGTDPRTRPVSVTLFENNALIGAQPGQGKTSAVRVITAAAALDPLCELWVHEHAGKGDLEPFARVAHRYVSGLDDESIGYAAKSLSMLRRELDTRSRKLKAMPKEARPDGKITREMGKRRSDHLYPLVAIFDEVQNVFMHPLYGAQAADDAAYVIRLGRAYGVILVLATQRPDKDSLPTAVSGNVSVRFCLRVPGQMENDMILGTSAYKNGYNAAAFRTKTDAGLGWLRAEGDPQIVRTYYLDLPACERICERARVGRQLAGTLTGFAVAEDESTEARSFAADVLSVFGDAGKLRCSTIARRLSESLPAVYADITPAAVGSQLRGLGVTVKNVREPGEVPGSGCERAAVEAVRP
jgi:DNA segregation ATPase FtsK/SpoIIIE, S-DNA-T family